MSTDDKNIDHLIQQPFKNRADDLWNVQGRLNIKKQSYFRIYHLIEFKLNYSKNVWNIIKTKQNIIILVRMWIGGEEDLLNSSWNYVAYCFLADSRVEVEFLNLTVIPSHPSQRVSPWVKRVKDSGGELGADRMTGIKYNKMYKMREKNREKEAQQQDNFSLHNCYRGKGQGKVELHEGIDWNI